MKEQKHVAWYSRINKKKTGALLLTICMFGSIVGCNAGSNESFMKRNETSSYAGAGDSQTSISDYETGNAVGGASDKTTGDFETETVVSGSTSDKTTEDFEIETPVLDEDKKPEGEWEDYIGDIDESIYMPDSLNNDPYRTNGGYAYYYHYQHGEKVMPIAAWSPPPPDTTTTLGTFSTNQITLDNYRRMADCGINTAYGLYARGGPESSTKKSYINDALTYADKTGIVYYVKDASAVGTLTTYGADRMETYYGWYMNRKAYGGTLVKDEPGTGDYYDKTDGAGQPVKPFAEFAEANTIWKESKYGKTKNMHVNNLPCYASAAQLYYDAGSTADSAPVNYSGQNWGNFVKEYVENVKPMAYSYDFYPFRGGTATFGNYYYSLSAARSQAAAGNIPYWVFCQVGYFNSPGSELTYAQTAIQVSTALAYGAKGIQWFNYWQPLEFAESCISACVDHYGLKTKYYPWVQSINHHVAAVDEVLMQCKNVGVIQIGNSYDAIPNGDKLSSYAKVTSTSGSSGDALIGCFEYRDTGKSVYYVASNNYDAGATVNLAFNGTYNVQTVAGTETTDYTNRNSIEITVPAGEGVLVVVG